MSDGEIARAVEHYDTASTMVPESAEMVYWAGVTLAGEGRVEESLPRFERAFGADPRWAVLTPRLVPAGLLPADGELLETILAVDGGEPGFDEWERLRAAGLLEAP